MSKEFSFLGHVTRLFVWAMVLLPILGCSPDVAPMEETAKSEVAATDDGLGIAPIRFGIGDVETSIQMTLSLSLDMDLPNVQEQRAVTRKKELAKVEVRVSKPYPEKMLLTLGLRIYDDFTGHAVRIIPHIFLDDKDVPLEGFILGGNARAESPEFTVDVFEHLDTIPSSILAYPKLEISFFPDTDRSEITLETPPTKLTQSITKLGNPVRIDFLP